MMFGGGKVAKLDFHVDGMQAQFLSYTESKFLCCVLRTQKHLMLSSSANSPLFCAWQQLLKFELFMKTKKMPEVWCLITLEKQSASWQYSIVPNYCIDSNTVLLLVPWFSNACYPEIFSDNIDIFKGNL